MSQIRSVRGMNDLLPEAMPLWRHIEQTARGVCEAFGYREIRTPVLEQAELFARGVGETTDIVSKEMYAFDDRGGDRLALRPEGTAGVVRAYVEHQIHSADAETRLYYIGPMYRRERPQKGRYRQFHQIGVEAFGSAAPELDAEVMAMLHLFLDTIGLQGVVLEVNSLGDAADRQRYNATLSSYLAQRREALCEDCVRRLDRAPMRVLDCKNERCREVCADAPLVASSLGEASQQHLDAVIRSLDRLQVPYRRNPRIVRGLDYYTHTVFEATSDRLGSQNAICGGGRYDGLVAQLGGPPTPAVGYAQGIERLALILQETTLADPSSPQIALIPVTAEQRAEAEVLAMTLRRQGIRCLLDLAGRSVKAQLRRANRLGAEVAIVLGEEELRSGRATWKPLRGEGEPRPVDLAHLQELATECFGLAPWRAMMGNRQTPFSAEEPA